MVVVVVFWLLPWFIYLFIYGCGLSFMGCNGLMLVGYCNGCGLIFMGCDGLMLVDYGDGCGLILVFGLILDFSCGGRW